MSNTDLQDEITKYINQIFMSKSKTNKIQCHLCSGYGMVKTHVKSCEICLGIKCMSCNSTGLEVMPYIDCDLCDRTGQIDVILESNISTISS